MVISVGLLQELLFILIVALVKAIKFCRFDVVYPNKFRKKSRGSIVVFVFTASSAYLGKRSKMHEYHFFVV